MTRLDRSPTLVSSGISIGAGVVTTVSTGIQSELSLLFCAVGVVVLGAGLVAASQALVTTGSGSLVFGTIAGGIAGAPALATLVGITAAILAWDAGGTAIGLGEQLGREAPTARLELVHATASGVVGLATVGAGYLIYDTATGGQPVSAVFGLLVAVLVLAVALRRASPLPE